MTQIADAPVDRETALAYYVQELTEGRDPSAPELAERFGRTDRWARTIRAEGAERFAEAAIHQEPTPETEPVPAGVEPVPAAATDQTPADVELTAETPAETRPIPAAETPNSLDPGTEAGGGAENLASFGQNQGQDATTVDPRPSGYPDPLGVTEAHTASPSWTVQDPAADLVTETAPVPAGTLDLPAIDHAVPAEREPEPTTPAGTVAVSAEPHPETAAEGPAERVKVPGRVVAWLAFILGILASVAANMQDAAEGGAHVAELVGAAFWPLALLLSIEVLTRVNWPAGRLWGVARFGGVGLVGAVAALLSYRHMAGLLTSWGEDALNAHVGPLAVDGLMLVAATALLAITHTSKHSDT